MNERKEGRKEERRERRKEGRKKGKKMPLEKTVSRFYLLQDRSTASPLSSPNEEFTKWLKVGQFVCPTGFAPNKRYKDGANMQQQSPQNKPLNCWLFFTDWVKKDVFGGVKQK